MWLKYELIKIFTRVVIVSEKQSSSYLKALKRELLNITDLRRDLGWVFLMPLIAIKYLLIRGILKKTKHTCKIF